MVNQPKDSVIVFLDKLGGIAYNKSLNPIDKEIAHILNIGQNTFSYWDKDRAKILIESYIDDLRKAGWTNLSIENDLKTEVTRLIKKSRNWTQFIEGIEGWRQDIQNWDKENDDIQQKNTIVPHDLFDDKPMYVVKLCQQINASYENNLFDCTAVIMRRLLEILLILSYKNYNIETEILDTNGAYHISLDKIVKNAEQNKTLDFSSNTRKDMMKFKELGNFSAHKIWFNCAKTDIEPHILKYRAIIEELLYKSGIK